MKTYTEFKEDVNFAYENMMLEAKVLVILLRKKEQETKVHIQTFCEDKRSP